MLSIAARCYDRVVRLRAAYPTPAALIIAHDRDMAHGGLLVAGDRLLEKSREFVAAVAA